MDGEELWALIREVRSYMDKYWSVGTLRLILDLRRSPRTSSLIDELIRGCAKRYNVGMNEALSYCAKMFENLLARLGYEVGNGVVNNRGRWQRDDPDRRCRR